MSGSAGLFNKKKFFFYLVGSPKVGGAGDGKHKKKYGHPYATINEEMRSILSTHKNLSGSDDKISVTFRPLIAFIFIDLLRN